MCLCCPKHLGVLLSPHHGGHDALCLLRSCLRDAGQKGHHNCIPPLDLLATLSPSLIHASWVETQTTCVAVCKCVHGVQDDGARPKGHIRPCGLVIDFDINAAMHLEDIYEGTHDQCHFSGGVVIGVTFGLEVRCRQRRQRRL